MREQNDKCGKSFKKRKTGRESDYKELESILFAWYQQARSSNIPIDGSILKAKALQVATKLGLDNFTASNGWICRFKDRFGLVYKKLAGESAAVDPETTDMWLERLPSLLEGYAPRDIYNADETGLFYNCLPDRTLTLKGESCHGGRKAKDRITVLLCANSDGTDKMKPIFIGKAIKPRCFKNVKTIPVKYHANKKAWMTTNIFLVFLRAIDATMGIQNRKILLFVDNCAAHPQDTSFLRSVRVIYYPPNCTSVLQPLDKGVIKCFKQLYRRRLVEKVICLLDAGKEVDKTMLNINVLQAIHFTVAAWNQVKESTVRNCFRRCGYNQDLIEIQELEPAREDNFEDDWGRMEVVDGVDFNSYVNVDNDLATCGVESIDALCDEVVKPDPEGTDEENSDAEEPEAAPSFAAALAAFETVKAFFYSHDNLDEREQLRLQTMEKSLFSLRRKTAVKQSTIRDFFTKK